MNAIREIASRIRAHSVLTQQDLCGGVGIYWRLVLVVAMIVFAPPAQASSREYDFDIPEEQMAVALGMFAKQSSTPLLFPHDEVQQLRANDLQGRFTVEEALEVLLKDTGVTGHINEDGVLTISVAELQQKSGETDMQEKPRRIGPIAAVFAAIFGAGEISAQDDTSDQEGFEEIVVRGIRDAQEASLDLKRNAAGFVDAISAEDIGKLPDQNIAEALQRITGVAIQRGRGEGDFVSIRGLGPEFVRSTVNGRTVISATEAFNNTLSGGDRVSTGRETNFDSLPSEVISTLEVIKSAGAEHVEGGIGGIVNVKTARPLDLGDKLSFSVESTYRDFNEETDPNVSGTWSIDNGDFGALFSVAYSERSIRDDRAESFGYIRSTGLGIRYDVNGDGDGDDEGDGAVRIPLSQHLNNFTEDRERVTGLATFQWRPDENTEWVLDILHSQRDINTLEHQALWITNGGAAITDHAATTVNADGSVIDPNLVARTAVGEQFATRFSHLFNFFFVATNNTVTEDQITDIGLEYNKSVGDWNYKSILSFVSAEADLTLPTTSGRADFTGVSFDAVFDTSSGRQAVTVPNGAELNAFLANPANYDTGGISLNTRTNEDQEIALQFDAEREIDNGLFSALKMGARIRQRDKELDSRFNQNGARNGAFPFTTSPLVQTSFVDDFLGGDHVGLDVSSALFNTIASADVFFTAQGGPPDLAFESAAAYEIAERTLAAYIQLDIDASIGDVAVVGNIGARVVNTDQDITGFNQPFFIGVNDGGFDQVFFTGEVSPQDFESSYANFLPSLNLRFELSEELYARVAASKTVTRPTFQDLAPALGINASLITANAGNPNLSPYESTNFDLGLEWYFADASALYATFFVKQLDDFIATVTNQNVVIQGVNFNEVTQPDNRGEGDISGLELGYQQALDNGLGWILNYTFTDSSANVDGVNLPLEGVSEFSYNATLFYENDRFDARLAYSFRDNFLLLRDAVFDRPIWADAYGQLDLSTSFRVTDNFSVFAEAINLTDEDPRWLSDNLDFLPVSESHIGTRFTFGVRGTFGD